MSNIASLTNEVLLAYVLPAALVELSFLLFIQNRWDLQWDLSAPTSLLGFLGLSVAVGFLIDALGHLLVREWQRRERERERETLPCLVSPTAEAFSSNTWNSCIRTRRRQMWKTKWISCTP